MKRDSFVPHSAIRRRPADPKGSMEALPQAPHDRIADYVVKEILYRSAKTTIARASHVERGSAVILKMLTSAVPQLLHCAQLRHEFALLSDINADGVIRPRELIEVHGYPVLVLEDWHACSLQAHWREQGRGSLGAGLHIAAQVAALLAVLHQRGIVHKDVNPSNVLWRAELEQVGLIDFGIASYVQCEGQELLPHLPRSARGLSSSSPSSSSLGRGQSRASSVAGTHPSPLSRRAAAEVSAMKGKAYPLADVGAAVLDRNWLAGTPAYLAPEQTGRINRTVEARTDLYALGVMLFELLSGQLPFVADDLAGYVHCHLAKAPPRLRDVAAEIPAPVCDLVARLLAKLPEDRPKSAQRVQAELAAYTAQWRSRQKIVAVKASEVMERFAPPQKLYGRGRERQRLMTALTQIQGGGGSAAAFVSGPSGIGKSALVGELKLPVLLSGGYYASGKFEQFRKNIPYQAISDAIQGHLMYLLTQPSAELESWRERLQRALGANAKVVGDVLPALRHLLGQPASVPALGPLEEKRRFHQTFKQFMAALGHRQHPLVLFVDDLQWADSGSLELLREILLDEEVQGLLLVGCYRSEEVDADHPLMELMAELACTETLDQIELQPMAGSHVADMMVDLFAAQAADAAALADVVTKNAAGNPFFIIELLRTLCTNELIAFDSGEGAWKWDIGEIARYGIADNVASLLAQRLQELPPNTLRTLQFGACMGNRFDLHVIATVQGQSLPACVRSLWPAVAMGLVRPVDPVHALVANLTSAEDAGELERLQVREHFTHDRIQRAVYDSIAPQDRAAMHLPLARHLLTQLNLSEQAELPEQAELLFDVADHVNVAESSVEDAGERRTYAGINYQAGQVARSASAYATAVRHLECAQRFLGREMWQREPTLAWQIHRALGEAKYLQGDIDEGVTVLEETLAHTDNVFDRCDVHTLLLRLYSAHRPVDAISEGRRALDLLGFPLPLEDVGAATMAEMQAVDTMLAQTSIASLSDRADVGDRAQGMAIQLLGRLLPPTYMVDQEGLFPLCAARATRMSIEFGLHIESNYSLSIYAILLRMCNRLQEAAEFGQLAVTLCQRSGDKVQTALVYQSYALFSLWLHRPMTDVGFFAETAYRCAVEVGEPQFASFALLAKVLERDFLGQQASEALELTRRALAYAKKCGERWSEACLQSILWHQATLQGKEDALSAERFWDGEHDEVSESGLAYYYMFRANVAYLKHAYRSAWEASCRADVYAGHIKPLAHWFYHTFCRSMIALELLDRQEPYEESGSAIPRGQSAAAADSDEEMRAFEGAVHEGMEALAVVAAQSPANFAPEYGLLRARQAEREGDYFAAVARYQGAAEDAEKRGRMGLCALANELCGRLWLRTKNQMLAQIYMTAAYRAYRAWGASMKTTALRAQYPVSVLPADVAVEWYGASTARLQEEYISTEQILSNIEAPGAAAIAADAVADAAASAGHPVGISNSTTFTTASGLGTRGHVIDASAVVKASQLIAQAIRREDVVERLVEIAVEAAGAQRGLLLVGDNDAWVVEAYCSTEGASDRLGKNQYSRALLMYTVRTKAEVAVEDALQDERFAVERYVMEMRPRSLLCLPVLLAAGRKTVLYLENNLLPGAFSPERMQVVRLLAAQAAISLDNSLLYSELETKVVERTRALKKAQAQLLVASRIAGQADVASNILHSVGNTLTGAKTVAGILREAISDQGSEKLGKAARLFDKWHRGGGEGSEIHAQMSRYLSLLDRQLGGQRREMAALMDTLIDYLAQIAKTVSSQREYLQPASVSETLALAEVFEIASGFVGSDCVNRGIELVFDVSSAPSTITCDCHKLVQILRCVLENAVDSLSSSERDGKRIRIDAVEGVEGDRPDEQKENVEIAVSDNGVGIAKERLVEIFRFGHSGKLKRYGFGLHMAANLAAELGGRLWAESEGVGQGARLVLRIPRYGVQS